MENIKNNLPKYWVVKNDGSQRFKDIVLQYLNNISDTPWVGDTEGYYGYDGNNNFKGSCCYYNFQLFKNNPTLLTIDEFIKLSKPISDMIDFRVKGTKLPVIPVGTIYKCRSFGSNVYKLFDKEYIFYSYGYREIEGIIYIEAKSKEYTGGVYFMIEESEIIKLAKEQGMIEEEFVLPEKWWVQSTEENYVDIYTWLRNNQMNSTNYTELHDCDKNYPICFPAYYNFHRCKGNSTYTEITFDQFKKYVLKQDTMEKEIIGYKLKDDCEKYKQAALSICNTVANWENSQMLYDIKVSQTGYISKLTVAGVLDLWFEPVYEEEYPNITINGYKGEFFNDYVKFGCAVIDSKLFSALYSNYNVSFSKLYPETNKQLESVTIGMGTFTKEQIKEIAEYYNAKISK